ncbi:hypothetical protein PS15m_007950 [Mucor circinelloides]
MRNKDLARTLPIDFYIPHINKKHKNTTETHTTYPYIPDNNNTPSSFYSKLMKPKHPMMKTTIEIIDDDEVDLLLDKLTGLSVKQAPKSDVENCIADILELKKTTLDILADKKDTTFDKRYEETEIPVPKEIVKPLTDQENAIVNRLFRKGQRGEVSNFKKATVSFQDLYRLYPETWLNDEIVNFYFELLSDRAANSQDLPSIHCFNTFFCSTLRDQGYAKVKRWTKRVDVFSKDILFVPINQSYHWVLGVMDMKEKTIAVYDSLGGNHDHTLNLFMSYLEQEHLDKKKTPFDTSDWKKLTPKDIPRQGNMSDCGAFACTFAERLSRRATFNFAQQDMETIRRRMALNIFNKTI